MNYFSEYRILIVRDLIQFYEAWSDIIELLDQIKNETQIYQNQQIIQDLVTLHALLRIERMTIKSEISIDSYQDFQRISELNKGAWYRGQADFKWKLIPSYYRSIPYTSSPVHVNYKYVDSDYISLGISKKIESIFGKYVLDYEKTCLYSTLSCNYAVTRFFKKI